MDIPKKIQVMESLQASMLKRLESLERLAQPVAVIEIPNIGLPGTSIVALPDGTIRASLDDHEKRLEVLEGLAIAEHVECHEVPQVSAEPPDKQPLRTALKPHGWSVGFHDDHLCSPLKEDGEWYPGWVRRDGKNLYMQLNFVIESTGKEIQEEVLISDIVYEDGGFKWASNYVEEDCEIRRVPISSEELHNALCAKLSHWLAKVKAENDAPYVAEPLPEQGFAS